MFKDTEIKNLYRIINLLLKGNKNVIKLNEIISVSYFKTLTRFALHHNYIIFNDIIYKQCTGLPLGGNVFGRFIFMF